MAYETFQNCLNVNKSNIIRFKLFFDKIEKSENPNINAASLTSNKKKGNPQFYPQSHQPNHVAFGAHRDKRMRAVDITFSFTAIISPAFFSNVTEPFVAGSSGLTKPPSLAGKNELKWGKKLNFLKIFDKINSILK